MSWCLKRLNKLFLIKRKAYLSNQYLILLFISSNNSLVFLFKKKMPKYCSVLGCRSSAREESRKFFAFPMLNRSNDRSLALSQTRQNAWFFALNRSGFSSKHFKNASVCDLHFVSGNCEQTFLWNVYKVLTFHIICT